MTTGRRWALLALLASIAVGVGASRPASPAGAPPSIVEAVGAVGLTVADLDRSVAFYTRVLGFEPLGEVETGGEEVERLQGLFGLRVRLARLRLGAETLELLEYLAPRDGRPIPADARPNDLAHWQTVLLAGDAQAAARALGGSACRMVSPGVARPDRAIGFSRGFLARDPDGHAFQVVER